MHCGNILAVVCGWFLLLAAGPCPAAVTINWNDVHQRIDGFGAACADAKVSLTSAQAEMFFSKDKGIGLSLLRNMIQPDGTVTAAELGTMKLAAGYGVTVWSTPWSPPAAWKTNNSTRNGGSLIPGYYQAYANQQADYVAAMKAQGIDLYAISMQNEPDYPATWASCIYTDQQLHDFIPYLYNALAAKGLSATKILAAEEGTWGFSLLTAILDDPVTSNMLGIFAAHNYGGKLSPVNTGGKSLWLTECSSFEPFNGDMVNGVTRAVQIHTGMTDAELNAYHYWWLVGLGTDNQGLTDQSGNPAKRMYALGNYSRFVRPGFYRIGITNNGGLLVSAYQDPASGKFAVVAINDSYSDVEETFRLNGFAAGSVTPWVTSAGLNLTSQAPVAVSNGSFVYTLRGGGNGGPSVVTFAGQATSTNVVALPVISPDGGLFIGSTAVTITCATSGAQVRYTTDGSTPTASSSLYTAPFTLTAATTVKAIGIKTGLAASGVAVAVFTRREAAIPYQINCGGEAAAPFSADVLYSGGGATGGMSNVITTAGAADTAPAGVYQSNRYGNFSYTLTGLSAGTGYTVRLHFAELFNMSPGARIFHVLLNGKMAQPNLDVVNTVGAANRALVKEFQTTADSAGKIVIGFITVMGNAICNGIEVLKAPTAIGHRPGPVSALFRPDDVPNPWTREGLRRLAGKSGVTVYRLSGEPVDLGRVGGSGIYLVKTDGLLFKIMVSQ